MKVFVYENRDLNVIEEYSTQNENDFEVMEFKFSSLFDNYNKKIVFLTPDGNISYYINNNIFSIPREITQYEQVKFYIWCTFEDKDFRTKLKILSFYKNENVNIDILPLEKAQIEQIINELEKNILIVQNLEKQTTNLIDEIETKLKNGDFVGPQGPSGPPGPPGPQGEPGESYDDTEIKEEISDIKEEQTTQNTRIEELEEQVQELENNQLTGTATGQSIYIEDSTNTKVRSIGLSGNSEQDGTPTPENPVEIHSTGDSGSVNEKVQNKNLWDEQWANGYYDVNGNLIQNNYYVRSKNYIPIEPSKKIYFPYDSFFKKYGSSSSVAFKVFFYNANKNFISNYQMYTNFGKDRWNITTPSNCYFITFYCTGIGTVYENNICISYVDTDYAPHEEQDISFPLAQGQKLMQGDYLADDGIHHVMAEDTVSGTTATLSDAKENGSYYCTQSTAGTLSGQVATFDSEVTDATIQYQLAEEVIDPYTEEQQAVWEQIKALRTYKPVTHISSTDEVPATVNVTYVKDLETVINNLGGA